MFIYLFPVPLFVVIDKCTQCTWMAFVLCVSEGTNQTTKETEKNSFCSIVPTTFSTIENNLSCFFFINIVFIQFQNPQCWIECYEGSFTHFCTQNNEQKSVCDARKEMNVIMEIKSLHQANRWYVSMEYRERMIVQIEMELELFGVIKYTKIQY